MNQNTENSLTQQPQFLDWGLIQYEQALEKQISLVEEVVKTPNHAGYIVICSHPHVVTTGRQTQADDIFAWQGPVVEISRGGRATYHGPSQVVIYPLLNLKNPRAGRGPQEIRGYLRDFEKAIVEAVANYGVNAVGKSAQQKSKNENTTEETGVWVENRKLASLGIAVKQWVTFHGAAINVDEDPLAFKGLNPCGFKSETMVSLESLVGHKIDRTEFVKKLQLSLLKWL